MQSTHYPNACKNFCHRYDTPKEGVAYCDPNTMRGIVRNAFIERVKKAVSDELARPEWNEKWEDCQHKVGELVKETILANAPNIVLAITQPYVVQQLDELRTAIRQGHV